MKIDGINISRETIEGGKTRIRMEKDGFIMGIVYPSVMCPKKVSDEQAIKIFKSEMKKETKPTGQNNEVIINAGDYKFSDFSSAVLKTTSNEEWFVKLREIDAKIHSHNLVDKTTFTDDRLVLIAYKIFTQSEIFDNSPSLRDWWIVKRYLEIYAKDDVTLINELRKVINMYIGFTFSQAVIDDEQKAELKNSLASLSKVVYEEGYIQLPQFVLDVIDGDKPVAGKKKGKSIEVPEYNFSEDEAAQWRGLRDTSAIMLEDTSDMTDEEIKMWDGAYKTSLIMLDED